MLKEKEVIELLKEELKSYISALENSSLYFMEHSAKIEICLEILNIDSLKVRFLDIDKAKELLDKIENGGY